MATTVQSDLGGLYKQVYADTILSLIPDVAKLTKRIEFKTKKKLGDYYHQPVVLAAEQGFTYSNTGGSFTLNSSVSMASKDAQVRGSQIAVRWRIAMDAVQRSIAGGAAAFKDATIVQMENVMESFGKRLEIDLLYGQSDTGLATTSTATATSATTTTVVFTAATWSYIWAGLEGAQFQFYDGTTLVSTGTDSIFTLTAVDIDNRSCLFTGTATGSTALAASTDGSTYVVFNGVGFSGGTYENMAGIDRIITNTGTLFNISASTSSGYSLWRGRSYSVGSIPLTVGTIIKGVQGSVGRGLSGDMVVISSPETWGNLATDIAAMRMIDSSYSNAKIDNGTQNIEYYYQGGKMEIMSHLCCKQGEAFAIPIKKYNRIGSTEITTLTPGAENGDYGDMFYILPDNMGYESRMYTDQALFGDHPAWNTKFTNIVNAT